LRTQATEFSFFLVYIYEINKIWKLELVAKVLIFPAEELHSIGYWYIV
jgi:hypothetical protein